MKEVALYPHVKDWLLRYLGQLHPRAAIQAFDTHKENLANFLRKRGLYKHFKGASAFEIQVDVTAIISTRNSVRLAFVECKIGPITLRDLGQMLGYSMVANPEWSFLLSPLGLSEQLSTLLLTYGRQDLLVYSRNRFVRLGTWNFSRRELDLSTVLPRGTMANIARD